MKDFGNKCPFQEVNGKKFCTHRAKAYRNNKHRKLCGYLQCKNCELFMDWLAKQPKGLREA